MTALLALALAAGSLLVFSALVNQPVADTFRSVINGQAATLADVTTSSPSTPGTQQVRPDYSALTVTPPAQTAIGVPMTGTWQTF